MSCLDLRHVPYASQCIARCGGGMTVRVYFLYMIISYYFLLGRANLAHLLHSRTACWVSPTCGPHSIATLATAHWQTWPTRQPKPRTLLRWSVTGFAGPSTWRPNRALVDTRRSLTCRPTHQTLPRGCWISQLAYPATTSLDLSSSLLLGGQPNLLRIRPSQGAWFRSPIRALRRARNLPKRSSPSYLEPRGGGLFGCRCQPWGLLSPNPRLVGWVIVSVRRMFPAPIGVLWMTVVQRTYTQL